MPHPGDDTSVAEPTADRMIVAVGCLSNVDVLANILAFLGVKDIMCKRRVCKKWKEAVKKTIVPLKTLFCVSSATNYNDMRVLTRAMPNLQQIAILGLGWDNNHKYSDGEDPDESHAAKFVDYTTHDIEIISNFSKLKIMTIMDSPMKPSLNGRYPFLFHRFPLLQKLTIKYGFYLKWDLEMLAGLPMLKELECDNNVLLTGNINSLRVLKDTLERVEIFCSCDVEGNFMDLADFPRLKELNLRRTAVTGDIRDIGENDFSSLEQITLPEGVYGGDEYELQRISDGPDLMRALYLLIKRRPALTMRYRWSFHENWYAKLSKDSPDWYESIPEHIRFVKAGSRVGYRWAAGYQNCCEVNWLDPEPDRDSSGYKEYIKELRRIENGVHFYRGFYQPPTEEEYNRLAEE